MKALHLYLHMVLFFFKISQNEISTFSRNLLLAKFGSERVRGIYHATCYLFKKLERFSRQLNFKNNGLVLLFKTIKNYLGIETVSSHLWLRMARMEMDWNLKRRGNLFKFWCNACEIPFPPPQITMFSAPPSNVLVSSVASLARFAAMLQNRLRVFVVPFNVDSYVCYPPKSSKW